MSIQTKISFWVKPLPRIIEPLKPAIQVKRKREPTPEPEPEPEQPEEESETEAEPLPQRRKGNYHENGKMRLMYKPAQSWNWGTPQEFFDNIEEHFGKFTLDACASKHYHMCDKYYTKEDDSLKKKWCNHRVWINPPFGNMLSKFIPKSLYEINREVDPAKIVVMLIPVRTDTYWFHDHILEKASEIWFVKQRLTFNKFTDDGVIEKGKYQSPLSFMIVVFEKHEGECKIRHVSNKGLLFT